MKTPVLHQFTEAATQGDAITDQALLMRRWLHKLGFVSEIYADTVDPRLGKHARDIRSYRPRPGEQYAIYHHSIGSNVADRLQEMPLSLILVYHNITPPQFFENSNPLLTRQVQRGREQLHSLQPQTALALAVSAYNEQDLTEAGYPETAVLPLSLDTTAYDCATDQAWVAQARQGPGPYLLFVGRLAPNKKPEDLVKLLYYYRRIRPEAHLWLAGSLWMEGYEQWLRWFIHDLGLRDHVSLLGHVSQEVMVSAYRTADLYVSMSEHEGFGKPLIESMYLNLPVLAYGSSGIPGTLGGAGVLFHEKNYEALAELVDVLIYDHSLRQKIIAQQHQRLQYFLEPQIELSFRDHLARLSPLNQSLQKDTL